jgi:hypothetical protein
MSVKERETSEKRLDLLLFNSLKELFDVCGPLTLKEDGPPEVVALAKKYHRKMVLADRYADGKLTMRLISKKMYDLLLANDAGYPKNGELGSDEEPEEDDD